MEINELNIEQLEMRIAKQSTTTEISRNIYNYELKELEKMKLQRERFLYEGMTKGEYISHLSNNPKVVSLDDYHFRIDGWIISLTIEIDGMRIYFSTDVYQDQSRFDVSITMIDSDRNFTYHSEYPKKHSKILDKIKELAFSLKMIQVDI
jgi:hypothetical protein